MTKKEQAIRNVIVQRVAAIDRVLKENTNLSPTERAYYLGKKEGLMQGHDLAGATTKSISIELQ